LCGWIRNKAGHPVQIAQEKMREQNTFSRVPEQISVPRRIYNFYHHSSSGSEKTNGLPVKKSFLHFCPDNTRERNDGWKNLHR
jgi:hypothetical protein